MSPTAVNVTKPTLIEGEGALDELSREGFVAEWLALWSRCPWATALQHPHFVLTWYRCYAPRYAPLAVARRGSDGAIDGLLLLGVEHDTGRLVFAGAEQAEYHVWLAPPEDGSFLLETLEMLKESRRFASLTFLFLPPGVPSGWLDATWRRRAEVRAVKKPVMEIGDGKKVRESLKKSGNRSRLNQLKRQGPLEFLQLKSPEELENHYEDIIAFTDFRQCAMNSVRPFADDPLKREFFKQLTRYPDLTHVTVMCVGGNVVSAHVGFLNRGQLILGLVAHSPFVAGQSPGKLHLLQLAQLLSEQQVPALDLTPGGDAYKDRFATHEEVAHVVTVYFDDKALLTQTASRIVKGWIKRAAAAAGSDPRSLRRFGERVKGLLRDPANALSGLRPSASGEGRSYRVDVAEALGLPATVAVRRDSLQDLLAYAPVPGAPSRQDFLQAAMTRLEAGQHAYTAVVDGVLAACAWVCVGGTAPEGGSAAEAPGSAVIDGLFAQATHRSADLVGGLLRAVLADLRARNDILDAVTLHVADSSIGPIVERLGFRPAR